MAQITIKVDVELAITFDYAYGSADPSVGIMSGGAEEITIDSIEGITPVIQLKTFGDLDSTKSTPKEMKLGAWLQFDSDLEQKIIAQVEDQIHEHAREDDYYDE